jgi:hypothetical protein
MAGLFPGSPAGQPSRRGLETAGAAFIALAVSLSLVFDFFAPAVAVLAGLLILPLVVGSAMRMLVLSAALMSVLTVEELSVAQFGVGLFVFRIDEFLLMGTLAYYLFALADGRTSGMVGRGILPVLVALFLAMSAFSVLRGLAEAASPDSIWGLRTFFGYAFFFPGCWLASDPEAKDRLWKALLVVGALAGGAVMFRAMTGIGEGVFLTGVSGLRVISRAPNVAAVMMVILVARIWKSPKRPPLILAAPALVVMAVAVILSQTRALWGGTLLALAGAWFLNLFRAETGKPMAKRLVVSLTMLAGLVVAGVVAVSMLGILSASDLSTRVQGEGAGYPIDISLLSRLLSWAAILQGMDGPSLLIGHGLGATVTYFKPEFDSMRTMYFIDGSFWQVLQNMGLAGVFLLASIYVWSAVSSARLFLRTRDDTRASAALGIFCALVVLLVTAQLGSVLTNYLYTVIWSLLLALLHVEWLAEKGRASG